VRRRDRRLDTVYRLKPIAQLVYHRTRYARQSARPRYEDDSGIFRGRIEHIEAGDETPAVGKIDVMTACIDAGLCHAVVLPLVWARSVNDNGGVKFA
jgi:hypothetical protein